MRGRSWGGLIAMLAFSNCGAAWGSMEWGCGAEVWSASCLGWEGRCMIVCGGGGFAGLLVRVLAPCPRPFQKKRKGKFVVVFPAVAKEDFRSDVDGKRESEKKEVEETLKSQRSLSTESFPASVPFLLPV